VNAYVSCCCSVEDNSKIPAILDVEKDRDRQRDRRKNIIILTTTSSSHTHYNELIMSSPLIGGGH